VNILEIDGRPTGGADNAWREGIEARIGRIENRLSILGLKDEPAERLPEVLELDLELPDMDIDGLRFNRTLVRHAVFDLKEDGRYHSRDILFISARNTENDNSHDILSEYLESERFKLALAYAISQDRNVFTENYSNTLVLANAIEVSLPEENQGVKKYNGVSCGYWLRLRPSAASTFCYVYHNGHTNYSTAGSAGGCAPVFRVRAKGGKE
jgi:hypothetical protein